MFVHRTVNACVAATCLAAGLTAGQTAYGVDVEKIGNTLYVLGNNSSEYVIIIGEKPGAVDVWASRGVEIGYTGVQNIEVDLQGGDNDVGMYDLDLTGAVTFVAGDGDNLFVLEESYSSTVTVELGDGDNDIRFGSDTATGGTGVGSLSVYTGAGRDRVSMLGVESASMTINTGAGDDLVGVGAGYTTWATVGCEVAGHLSVATAAGEDTVVVAATDVYGDTLITLGRHADILATANLGGSPANEFYGDFTARGGAGQDTLYDLPENVYHNDPVFQSFELP